MVKRVELSNKELVLARSILSILLRNKKRILFSEIKRESKFTPTQIEHLLKFLYEKHYIIPKTVPAKNKILAKWGLTKRGRAFLKNSMAIERKTNSPITFNISGKELENTLDFIKNHKCGLKNDLQTGGKKVGAIGGEISYQFTPTSLGTAITIKCACGKEKNVTNYDYW